MSAITPNLLKTWKISYNPYTDLFQMFNEDVFRTPDNKLQSKRHGFVMVLYEKNTQYPMLFEMKDAYKHIGNIDNMSRKDIINSVMGYVKLYG